jgi:hypothetical protein
MDDIRFEHLQRQLDAIVRALGGQPAPRLPETIEANVVEMETKIVRRRYTAEEDFIILGEKYKGTHSSTIAVMLNRTEQAIDCRYATLRRQLGFKVYEKVNA